MNLEPLRWQFPPDAGDWDDRWLVIDGHVDLRNESWSFTDPCLLIAEARELAEWLRALNAFLVGALRREVTERRTARSTGTDEPTFQASLGPYLTRMFKSGRYPTIARLVIDGTHLNAEETFNHNLTTVLDGITSHPHT